MRSYTDAQRLHELDAWEAASLLARREITAVALTQACLNRIEEREPLFHAFAYLQGPMALARAKLLDEAAISGLLHGLPLGVKDLFDTADMLTAYGSPIYPNHRPQVDAAAVALCKDAGAVIVGKTVTTELANMQPAVTCAVTRNPHDLSHTPGGSSSGSAAAVADCMLPLALGTQTAGSLIRPAAYCGVVGFKPSHNFVSKAGVKSLSESLDTVGVFARSVRDIALIGSVLTSDAQWFASMRAWLMQNPQQSVASDSKPVQRAGIRIGFCQTPEWQAADADTQKVWAFATQHLPGHELSLTSGLSNLVAVQKEIQAFETARSLRSEHRLKAHQLSETLRQFLQYGDKISGATHAQNLQTTLDAKRQVADLFRNVDVIVAPSTTGAAPQGLTHTGDPVFCRTWTLLGLPCIHLPFAHTNQGLPMGLQLVGAYGQDHRLLMAAHTIHQQLLTAG
jgi:Asp-tRNA(Asn)/Glu-tRNA(Gln) amidotransferase A subunit family amidase